MSSPISPPLFHHGTTRLLSPHPRHPSSGAVNEVSRAQQAPYTANQSSLQTRAHIITAQRIFSPETHGRAALSPSLPSSNQPSMCGSAVPCATRVCGGLRQSCVVESSDALAAVGAWMGSRRLAGGLARWRRWWER